MEYITSTGKVLTDKDFDEMAKEYETGKWQGALGVVAVGRPRLSDEGTKSVSIKFPSSRITAIDKAIAQSGQSRSEFIRDAVDRALVSKLLHT